MNFSAFLTCSDGYDSLLNNDQKEFVEFVLSRYIEIGVEELNLNSLPTPLESKNEDLTTATDKLGDVSKVISPFIEFQKYLYSQNVA